MKLKKRKRKYINFKEQFLKTANQRKRLRKYREPVYDQRRLDEYVKR